jgi:transforming growth factor-beta-induced protein
LFHILLLQPGEQSAAVSKVASVIVALILVAAAVAGIAAYYKSSPEAPTVLAALQRDGDFSTLVNALSVAGVSGMLSSSSPYTVFAPTNEAFSRLPAGNLTALLDNPPKLASLLDYSIVPGDYNESYMFQQTSLVTLQGRSLNLSVFDTGLVVDENASLTQAPISCTNGVIYPIDTVLMPPKPAAASKGLMTVFQTAKSLGLSYLVEGLEDANLAATLSSPGPYTLFAPTDSAMTFFSCGSPYDNCLADLDLLFSNQSAVTLVMQDNIASGNFTSSQLLGAGFVTTLAGQTLAVTSTSGVVHVGSATVTQKDIRCSNGYIDITDLILVPPSVNH